jgi:hypothetical protein
MGRKPILCGKFEAAVGPLFNPKLKLAMGHGQFILKAKEGLKAVIYRTLLRAVSWRI